MTERTDAHTDDAGRGFIGLTRDLASAGGSEGLTLGQIRDRLDERGFGLLILILSIPCLVPALYGVPQAWLDRMADFAEKRMGWFERLSRPRLQALSTGFGERLAALFMILATLTIVLPLMNTVPSVALAMLAVGLIQRDGVFVLLGAMTATAWASALIAVALGVYYGASWASGFTGYFQ